MAQKIEGILCRKDRTFYYLETGNLTPRNNIDRLRGILLRRDLISYHRTDSNDRSPPYRIITLEEAQEKGLNIEVVYLNKHIEQTVKAQKEKRSQKANPWGR